MSSPIDSPVFAMKQLLDAQNDVLMVDASTEEERSEGEEVPHLFLLSEDSANSSSEIDEKHVRFSNTSSDTTVRNLAKAEMSMVASLLASDSNSPVSSIDFPPHGALYKSAVSLFDSSGRASLTTVNDGITPTMDSDVPDLRKCMPQLLDLSKVTKDNLLEMSTPVSSNKKKHRGKSHRRSQFVFIG